MHAPYCPLDRTVHRRGGTLFRRDLAAAALSGVVLLFALAVYAEPRPTVEAEEMVYRYASPDNGSGPLWCRGSTCIVRVKDEVFASGMETLPDALPLNNCRWTLFQRLAEGWKQVALDPSERTREPSPLVAYPDGRVLLSVNPTLTTDPRAGGGGPARPAVLVFNAAAPESGHETLLPTWDGAPAFTEHSYRSFAADGVNGELILFQNVGYTHAEWTFLNKDGEWARQGKLAWPWGAEYDKPQPIRVCYPNTAIKDRAVHFCGVSDIVEPYDEWRAFKKELTGNEWDYDFRRLFYTWTRDIATGAFEEWVELASRDKTCGWVMPGDLWIAPDGAAHIVWAERAIDERLRERFFPEAKQRHEMNYAVVREGKAALRRTLSAADEDRMHLAALEPRFHATPDNRLFVFYYVGGADPENGRGVGNYLLELGPDGAPSDPVAVPLAYPLSGYFTASPRGGSPPSAYLELLGARDATTMGYARIRVDASAADSSDQGVAAPQS